MCIQRVWVLTILRTTIKPLGKIRKNQVKINLQNTLSRISNKEWGCTSGNAATVAHSTKKKQAEKIP
jgi:hypothetical protein